MKRAFQPCPAIVRITVLALFFVPGIPALSQDENEYIIEEVRRERPVFRKHHQEPPVLNRKELSDRQVQDWKADEDFWYADREFRKATPARKEYTPIARRTWFQTLLWLLILGGFVGVLFWFLSENRVGLFNRRPKPDATSFTGEDIPEDIFAINYQKEIDNALRLENYRLAVRLMFLRLLKTLSEREVIRYKQDKTNLDYLFEVQPTAHYDPFFRVVRNYDYSWYGQFPVSRDAYEIIKKDFDLLDRQLYRQ